MQNDITVQCQSEDLDLDGLRKDRERLLFLVFSDVSILRDGETIAIVDGSEPIEFLPWREAIDKFRGGK
jgi:hypothetical protein